MRGGGYGVEIADANVLACVQRGIRSADQLLAQREPPIFRSFEARLPGQTLELINHHDPQPLNAQFQLRAPTVRHGPAQAARR